MSNETKKDSPLVKAAAIAATKFKEYGITVTNQIWVPIIGVINPMTGKPPYYLYYNTDKGSFLLKGELNWWVNASKYVTELQPGPGVAINSKIFDTWLVGNKCTFLYWCVEQFENKIAEPIYKIDFEDILKKVNPHVQIYNSEFVRVVSVHDLKQWLPWT